MFGLSVLMCLGLFWQAPLEATPRFEGVWILKGRGEAALKPALYFTPQHVTFLTQQFMMYGEHTIKETRRRPGGVLYHVEMRLTLNQLHGGPAQVTPEPSIVRVTWVSEGGRHRFCATEPAPAGVEPPPFPEVGASSDPRLVCFEALEAARLQPPKLPPEQAPEACFAECARRDMARAVAPQQIEHDCARTCGLPAPPPLIRQPTPAAP